MGGGLCVLEREWGEEVPESRSLAGGFVPGPWAGDLDP